MPNPNQFDLDYAPESYWETKDVLSAILTNVKGQERREMIRHYHKKGMLNQLDDTLLEDTMTDEQVRDIGGVGLAFWGGEYLPNYQSGGVEIARVCMRSTLSDVISIRAALKGKKIHYDVVDEHDNEFELLPKSSARPLTFRELISLIDTCHIKDDLNYVNLVLMYREENYRVIQDIDLVSDFVYLESSFYPELNRWYEDVAEEWCQKKLNEEEKNNIY